MLYCKVLMECRTLWGKPEQVHAQNSLEQLHAHYCYQNMTV